jgi:hypothetical protein
MPPPPPKASKVEARDEYAVAEGERSPAHRQQHRAEGESGGITGRAASPSALDTVRCASRPVGLRAGGGAPALAASLRLSLRECTEHPHSQPHSDSRCVSAPSTRSLTPTLAA